MASITSPRIVRIMQHQRCLITATQAEGAGLSPSAVRWAVRHGHWVVWHPGVYGLAGAERSTEMALLAACLATGGRASHRSAAWLHGLVGEPPPQPEVVVDPARNNRRDGIVVHRRRGVSRHLAAEVRGVPCTTALEAVLDVAATLHDGLDRQLDHMVDVALARQLFPVDRLETAVARRAGRQGTKRLAAMLVRRGYAGAPNPSVLESQVLRLLGGAGIIPLACEHPVGPFRLDILLAPRLALEVDGYAYHANPEQATRDRRRRRRLRRQGWEILVYTWLDVRDEPALIIDEVRRALAEHAA